MASNFPTAYVRVASQTYVLQHIIHFNRADKSIIFGPSIPVIPPTGVGARVAAAPVLPRALVEVPARVVVGSQLVAWAPVIAYMEESSGRLFEGQKDK